MSARIYDTDIVHVRTSPVSHRFRYRSASWLIDVDTPPTVPRWLRPVVGFRAADHLWPPHTGPDTLRRRVEQVLRERDIEVPNGPITALLNARSLGYVFDPLTVYWCHDNAGRVRVVLAEVHNTYGGRHAYVIDSAETADSVPGERATVDKQFYVSPFNEVEGRYRLRLPEPDGRLAIDIVLDRPDQAPFTTRWRGTGHAADTRRIIRTQLRAPLVPILVTARIRLHGIRLWAKGLPIVPRNTPHSTGPESTSPSGVRAQLLARPARSLLTRAARRSGVTVLSADDAAADGPHLRLRDPIAVGRRIGDARLIGFGEAYVAREWDTDDLAATLTAMASNMPGLVPSWIQRLRPLMALRRPPTEVGSLENVQDNISRHYDLSNELFSAFLDETLTYSSALFCTQELPTATPTVTDAPDPGSPAFDDLADAQRAKIDRLLDAAGVGPGTRLLEVGTGWGELCIRAARRGARVHSVTLSVEQRDLAQKRIAQAGLSELVDVEILDYREVRGSYDAIVSVEMIEAVGAAHWDEYFASLAQSLAPGGRIAIQAITMPHDRMLASLNTYTWIQKYIFPGGMLPSTEAITISAERAGLAVRERHRFARHYAETLRLWRERFLAEPDSLPPPADSAQFQRLWEFYLAYSEAGFRSGYIDVQQIVLCSSSTTTQGEPR